MSKTLTIPWAYGNGNIIITYTGEGDGVVIIQSDTDNDGYERSQQITLRTADSSVSQTVTIIQRSLYEFFITADPAIFCDKDDKAFLVRRNISNG
jgi:hypothetical protein